MFCILPCAPIRDTFNLSPVGPSAAMIPQMDKTRTQLRRLSNTDHLITIISEGEVIMTRKVAFDNYLKSHVDLMRSYVSTFTPCNFAYGCFFTPGQITTNGLQPRDQWALQIVMSRLNISSIYQAGALNSMRVVFLQTANSYRAGFKATSDLVKNIQITYQYFNEGYQPIKRLLPYFDAIEGIASAETRGKYLELNKQMFEVYSNLLTINLAFLKIQKLRLLNEFKTCKQASYAVYLRVTDSRLRLAQLSGKYKVLTDISDFFALAELFYQVLAFYFLLVQHEDVKQKEDFGFVKKEFQQMIYDNIVAIEEIERLMNTVGTLNHENDNTNFAMGVLKVIMEDVQRFKYRYSINVHENKMEKPKIQEVVARRIGASTIWDNLDFF